MLKVLLFIVVVVSGTVVLAEGNAERGQTLSAPCAACHGAEGISPAGAFPNLAAQGPRYLGKQMHDIRSGAREVVVMTGQLDSFSDQDLEDLAAYYSGKTGGVGVAKAELADQGETIYRAGIMRKKIAACTACHLPNGRGNDSARFPALAGQWPEYVESQLKAFRIGVRHNDGESQMMRGTTMDLSDQEIAAVASYIYGLR